MKKFFLVLTTLMLFVSSAVVKADVYRDELRAFMHSGAPSILDKDVLAAQLKKDGVNLDDYSVDQLIDDAVEILLPYFRENFTEEQMKQYVAFYSQPQMIELTKNNALAMEVLKRNNRAILLSATMKIMADEEPVDIAPSPCDSAYLAAFEKYWQISDFDNTLTTMMTELEKALIMMSSQASPEEQEMTQQRMSKLFAYVKRNFRVVSQNAVVSTLSLEDIETYVSVADQPFYPAMQQMTRHLAGDMVNFLAKILELGQKITNNQKSQNVSK